MAKGDHIQQEAWLKRIVGSNPSRFDRENSYHPQWRTVHLRDKHMVFQKGQYAHLNPEQNGKLKLIQDLEKRMPASGSITCRHTEDHLDYGILVESRFRSGLVTYTQTGIVDFIKAFNFHKVNSAPLYMANAANMLSTGTIKYTGLDWMNSCLPCLTRQLFLVRPVCFIPLNQIYYFMLLLNMTRLERCLNKSTKRQV